MGLRADVTATVTGAGDEAFTVDAGFDVASGETLVVLGPSGSGKTLLLETVAGFHANDGRVGLDGRRLDDRPPEERGFGFVFQDYALFPHRSVRENVAFGTRYHDETRAPDELLAELEVGDLAERYPTTLSGGEQQRVALARSLAIQPDVLLLDEPLASLDVPTRKRLRDDLADVLADVTTVYVTHDRTTARALADQLAVMYDGGIVQTGTPADVFERPTSPMVARFTGANCLALSAAPTLADALDDRVAPADHVAVRPGAVALDRDDGDVEGTVERVVREGPSHRAMVAFDDVVVDVFTDVPLAGGEDVKLTFPPDRVHPC